MRYLLSILLLISCNMAEAQYKLQFCEDVSNEGKAQMLSNSFMVDGSGGVLKFLAKAESKFDGNLEFRIYYMNDQGKEEEITRMPQIVEPDWNFAWKEVVFFDPGNYKVKLYNNSGTYLTSANLVIKKK